MVRTASLFSQLIVLFDRRKFQPIPLALESFATQTRITILIWEI